jgi:hypothetical protein
VALISGHRPEKPKLAVLYVLNLSTSGGLRRICLARINPDIAKTLQMAKTSSSIKYWPGNGSCLSDNCDAA